MRADAQARVFVALWPTASWSEALLQACAPLLSSADGQPLLPSDLHVTLAFLGAIPVRLIPALSAALQPLADTSVALRFARVVYWRHERCLVAEADDAAASAALAARVVRVAQQQRLAPQERTWRGHITLARSVRSPPLALCADGHDWPMTPLVLRDTQLALAQSLEPAADARAQRYQLLSCWPLGEAAGERNF